MTGDALATALERMTAAGEAMQNGGPPRDMVIRVTRIYRRTDGDWKLVHRHADFPPSDQRTSAS
jgi:ketosteroid isomerase-like protein